LKLIFERKGKIIAMRGGKKRRKKDGEERNIE